MKKLFVALAFAAMASQAPATTGNDLLQYGEAQGRLDRGSTKSVDYQSSAYFSGFVAGAAFTLDAIDPKVCLPSSGNVGQFSAVVYQYLKQNPAQLHLPGQLLVMAALRTAFPCR